MSWARRLVRAAQVSSDRSGTSTDEDKLEVALIAGGCFWGLEELIRQAFGEVVVAIECVYTGDDGHPDPIYFTLGRHAEAVMVRYDPTKLDYAELIDYFFRCHDPSEKNRQGNDVGLQYRSCIWYTTEAQLRVARRVRDRYNLFYQKQVNGQLVQTKILPAGKIWRAERHHQRYLEKHPGGYRCPSHWLRPRAPAGDHEVRAASPNDAGLGRQEMPC